MTVPVQIVVSELVSSRYGAALGSVVKGRPSSWDTRKSGIDVVRTESGETVKLLSDGQQSPPEKGWKIVLTEGDSSSGFRWTLYGLPRDN